MEQLQTYGAASTSRPTPPTPWAMVLGLRLNTPWRPRNGREWVLSEGSKHFHLPQSGEGLGDGDSQQVVSRDLCDTVVFLDFGGTLINSHEVSRLPELFLEYVARRSSALKQRMESELLKVRTDRPFNEDPQSVTAQVLRAVIETCIRSTNPFSILRRLGDWFAVPLSEEEICELVEMNDQHILAQIEGGRCAVIEGAINTIVELSRRGSSVVIVSNCPRNRIEIALAVTNLHSFVSGVVAAEDTRPRRSKPDPTPYLYAKRAFLKPTTRYFCAVEDSVTGISAAQGASCPVLVFNPPLRYKNYVSCEAIDKIVARRQSIGEDRPLTQKSSLRVRTRSTVDYEGASQPTTFGNSDNITSELPTFSHFNQLIPLIKELVNAG